jgi:class 3 adenylate cyclase
VIRYAKTPDGFNIAYEVSGSGPVDHLFLSEFGSSLEGLWDHPAHTRNRRFMESLGRLIVLDRRGVGCSDPVPAGDLARLDDYVTDMLAVIDEVGADQVVVTAEGSAGAAGVRFAVTHPERTLRLVLLNSSARGLRGDGYDIGFTPDEADVLVSALGASWGTGVVTSQYAPALAGDQSLIEICARRERLTASPTTAEAIMRSLMQLDIRELLPAVAVPTLVYFTGDLLHLPAEHSRYLAHHIPGAILIEAPGRTFYVPDDSHHLDEWAEFVVGGPARISIERRLATVLFTDVVASTRRAAELGDEAWAQLLEDMDRFVRAQVEKFGGRLVKQTGDGHLAVFDQPSAAVHAAVAVARGAPALGIEMRCGVHVGDLEFRPDGDIGGIAVHTAARVMDAGGPTEVVVSRTVSDLAAGAGIRFDDRGEHDLKGVPGRWQLFAVE